MKILNVKKLDEAYRELLKMNEHLMKAIDLFEQVIVDEKTGKNNGGGSGTTGTGAVS